ncbi:hypothetical protein ACFXJ8_33465 [Nonomuraea sp. NPDC059194]|uniref:hypothetical protein n=1 Tax=Nonomuraea sp. NPDC059194 TaxID=3346764 RepID=UPI003698ACFC
MATTSLPNPGPLPGAAALLSLRARARSARRFALIALTAAIAAQAATQLLAERAPTREGTRPLAWLALAVFALAVPALVATQAIWASRARRARERERALYGHPSGGARHAACRLGMAGGWLVTLLLGFTVPRLFEESALYGTAESLAAALEVVALAGLAVGVLFTMWWTREALASRTRSPHDPWDPGRVATKGPAAWAGAAVATAALVAARAHLWEPATWLVCALLVATLVPVVVTRE